MKRDRMTERMASERPAVPWEGTEHPADQGDPNYEDYKQGDPSAWAEDPKEPPYSNGERPAVPWEGTEHPAAAKEARVAAEKKASKTIKLATLMLGNTASVAAIEDQALDLMDLSDDQINASLSRLSGGFMGAGDEPGGEKSEDAMLAEMLKEDGAGTDGDVKQQLASLTQQVAELTHKLAAAQNDPKSFYTGFDVSRGPGGKSAKKAEDEELPDEDEEVPEEGKTAGCHGHDVFDEYDADDDGFLTRDEWGGALPVFDSLDGDADGIVSYEEAYEGMGPSFSKLAAHYAKYATKKGEEKDDEEKDDEKKDDSKLPDFLKKEAKKAEEDPETEEDPEAEEDPEVEEPEAKEGGKKAKKAEEDPEEEGVKKEACNSCAKTSCEGCSNKEAATDAEEEARLEALKSAGALDVDMTPKTADDMGLDGDEKPDPKLAALFGKFGADEEPVEEKKEDDVKKEAAQKPQPRKPGGSIKTLGAMQKSAAVSSDVKELEKLWGTAPDVSKVFAGK